MTDAEKYETLKMHVVGNRMLVVLSYGMGVESTAILLRWIMEPETCPCDLSQLIVITSQVGDEWPDTGTDVETHILPLLRKHGIRFVQVARAGHNQEDGIVVLDDSRSPQKVYLDGAYKLSDELKAAGTVPQFGGKEHRCALKFKSFVIEKWLDENVRQPARHAFGYNSEETSRVDKAELRFTERIAFGFNSEEVSRAERGKQYDTPYRVGYYPLLEWNWSRQDCIDYIKSIIGVTWKKSACVGCPYGHNRQNMSDLVERQKKFPNEVAQVITMEYISLSMNHRSPLYATRSLKEMVEETENFPALSAFEKLLDSMKWAIYRVRRLYLAKGKAHRCTEKIVEDLTRTAAQRKLAAVAKEHGEVTTLRDISYLFLQEREEDVYPTKEEYFTACPQTVETKARYGVPRFDKLWRQHDVKQLDMFEETA